MFGILIQGKQARTAPRGEFWGPTAGRGPGRTIRGFGFRSGGGLCNEEKWIGSAPALGKDVSDQWGVWLGERARGDDPPDSARSGEQVFSAAFATFTPLAQLSSSNLLPDHTRVFSAGQEVTDPPNESQRSSQTNLTTLCWGYCANLNKNNTLSNDTNLTTTNKKCKAVFFFCTLEVTFFQ